MKILTIENKAAKVKLNDSVNPWSTDDLIADIEKAYGDKAVAENMTVAGFMASADQAIDTLEIEVNSPGGSVLDGFRIYEALKSMRNRGVRVIATINSIAASMASVIVMAADEIRMVEGGRMMIHEASTGLSGTAADHARAAKVLEEMSAEIAIIYAERTGTTPEEMRALMLAETWMGTKEAKERGFIDTVISGGKPKAEGVPFDIGTNSVTIREMSILDRILKPSSNESAELLAEAKARLSTLESELTAAATELQSVNALLIERDQTIAENAATIDRLTAEVSAAAENIVTASNTIEKLTADLEEANKSAAKLAMEMLASAGQSEPIATNGGEESPPMTFEQKLQNMSPADRRRAFKAHKAAQKK